jgi:hypothetical protein
MKYVKSTHGIYDVEKMGVSLYDGIFIKQGDTIEELCDVFVKENDYCGQVSQSMYSDFEKAKQDIDISSYDVIYGALKTADNGLIYVAKMNDEGELELL